MTSHELGFGAVLARGGLGRRWSMDSRLGEGVVIPGQIEGAWVVGKR